MLALSSCECQKAGEHVPTYQYACTDCDHRFEAVQAFSDASLTVCPECGGKLRKVFNAVGVVFKGSGFYRNDSRATQSTSEPAAAEKKPAATEKKSGDSNGSSGSGATSGSTSGTTSGSKTGSGGSSEAKTA